MWDNQFEIPFLASQWTRKELQIWDIFIFFFTNIENTSSVSKVLLAAHLLSEFHLTKIHFKGVKITNGSFCSIERTACPEYHCIFGSELKGAANGWFDFVRVSVHACVCGLYLCMYTV